MAYALNFGNQLDIADLLLVLCLMFSLCVEEVTSLIPMGMAKKCTVLTQHPGVEREDTRDTIGRPASLGPHCLLRLIFIYFYVFLLLLWV